MIFVNITKRMNYYSIGTKRGELNLRFKAETYSDAEVNENFSSSNAHNKMTTMRCTLYQPRDLQNHKHVIPNKI